MAPDSRPESSHNDSRIAVYAAFAGNLAIALSKFAAFGFTRSTAMLTEAVHSLVDTGNQGLLLLGMRRARRPPDAGHPFGHGMELYFWSFVVALMIFTVGGVLSIYEGVQRIRNPEPMVRVWVNYLVLGASILFEGGSFAVAMRQQKKRWPTARLIPFLKHSKDPGLFAVLIEDAAALVGLVIAFVGITAAVVLRQPMLDGVASVGIGVLLILVAVFMANETRSLLTGEAATPEVTERVRARLAADPRICRVVEVLSLHLGPEEILIGVTLDFDDHLPGGEIERAATELSAALQADEPRITRVFLRPGSAVDPAETVQFAAGPAPGPAPSPAM